MGRNLQDNNLRDNSNKELKIKIDQKQQRMKNK